MRDNSAQLSVTRVRVNHERFGDRYTTNSIVQFVLPVRVYRTHRPPNSPPPAAIQQQAHPNFSRRYIHY